MNQSATGPTRLGYLIALIVFVLGSVGALALVVLFVTGILDLTGSMQRFVVPGVEEIELEETGRYTIYYEHRSTVGGREFDTSEQPPDLDVTVTSVETGEPVPVSAATGNVNYNLWDREGESYLSFRIDEPGTYEIMADYPGGADGPEVVLAVGEGLLSSIFLSIGAILGAGALFCGTIVVALIIVVVTLVRRSRSAASSPA